MAISASSLFTRDELSYRDMLENGGVFVDDRWFPKDSSENERASYHASYLARQERNRRRREIRRATGEHKPRVPHLGVSQSVEMRVANRLPLEHRKSLRRSTISACPKVSDIRTAWRFRDDSIENRLRLGSLLMDLECYLDNSLIVIHVRSRSQIVGRNGGLREWIREKCPELEPHYKTLQRIKGLAKLVRQRLEVFDPVPLSAVMDTRLSGSDIRHAQVHVQPRKGNPDEVTDRFVWEKSDYHYAVDGRQYLRDWNYYLARRYVSAEVADHLPGIRAILHAAIILNGKDLCANENYSAGGIDTGRNSCANENYSNGSVDNGRLRRANENYSAGGFGEMFRYIGRHPEFLVEVGVKLAGDIGRGLREGLLPERTNRRILDGEKVGVGRLVLDYLDAYMQNVYKPCLVYRWGRGG